MSSDSLIPPRDENDALVRALEALSKKDKRLVKSTRHVAPADPSIVVKSWKMNEFKYAVHPSPFPTLARGLFTRWIPDESSQNESSEESSQAKDKQVDEEETGPGRHTIVARGYDKFFNIGEVPWNSWSALEKYTCAPYHLTLKSNGCIIFIAALTPEKVVVTSKHSLGHPLTAGEITHAMMGEKWLIKHLEKKGKTIEELAARLYKENLTAVAELCDDSFEEHVLGYPPELTGLHLHGLNRNQGTFSTLAPSIVDEFAAEYGFIQTARIELPSIKAVREFTDEVGTTGKWRGEPVEGFVVRTYIAQPSASASASTSSPKPNGKTDQWRDQDIPPPYPSGSDFFFKVKFDEPYLMYRAWREITKTIISYKRGAAKDKNAKPLSIPKSRLARPESRLYRDWVDKEIDARPEYFAEFSKGKNIIATRDKFIEWLQSDEGRKKLKTAQTGGRDVVAETNVTDAKPEEKKVWGKTVIVPIAVPGCGKTAVAVALSRLFGFGHTQSDDVKSKKTAPTFGRNIAELLKTHDVVIADRNNHLSQHRLGIREAVAKAPGGPVRLVALHWSLRNLPIATVHRVCSERVLQRGENHQSLRPSGAPHEDIIWQFITSTEDVGESSGPEGTGEVDEVIEMDVLSPSLEELVTQAVDGLLPLLPSLSRPTAEEISEACDLARGYRVSVRKDDGPIKKVQPRYYGLLAEVDLHALLEKYLFSTPGAQSSGWTTDISRPFWEALKSGGRVAVRPHVTIAHKSNLPAVQSLWDGCAAIQLNATATTDHATEPLFEFSLGNVLCDGSVMSITVEDVRLRDSGKPSEAVQGLLDQMTDDLRAGLHITVGTKDQKISPVEGGKLVQRWKKQENGIEVIPLRDERGIGRIKGLV